MDYHAIMSLLAKGRTYSEITASVGCSHRDVAAAKRTMTAAGITEQRLASLSAADLQDLFPDQRKAVSGQYADPYFVQVIEQMKHNRFFTLKQGWVNYLAGTSSGKKGSAEATVVGRIGPGRPTLSGWTSQYDDTSRVSCILSHIQGVGRLVPILPASPRPATSILTVVYGGATALLSILRHA